ncbi:hypothetical protein PLEOSDRAFT_1081520 [Pleurotus ostreatus PC15]|uniref:Uncharacterized protein n=1 Tax=Pleurotus ostreatus (strain PC15) TaxID=1137138 RepID=A0A067NZE4_PLEO1|nr:hypothetical protein PLEOSDRAFT_1081520 [Pleurotus ostreatus PC15]
MRRLLDAASAGLCCLLSCFTCGLSILSSLRRARQRVDREIDKDDNEDDYLNAGVNDGVEEAWSVGAKCPTLLSSPAIYGANLLVYHGRELRRRLLARRLPAWQQSFQARQSRCSVPRRAPPILARSSAVCRHRILRPRDTQSSVRARRCGRSFVHSLVRSTLGWVSDGCEASEHPYQTETNGIASQISLVFILVVVFALACPRTAHWSAGQARAQRPLAYAMGLRWDCGGIAIGMGGRQWVNERIRDGLMVEGFQGWASWRG